MEPNLTFIFNHSNVDAPYDFATGSGTGGSVWREITPGIDTVIYTGGGIDDWNPWLVGDTSAMTLASGSRSPTIRPAVTSYMIPHVFVESAATMYRVPSASSVNIQLAKAYAFGVAVSGTIQGSMYLEAWDDFTFTTFALPVLAGSSNSGNESYVNAINIDTAMAGNGGTMPWPWDGNSSGAAFLRGDTDRVAFIGTNLNYIENEMLFFNIYIRLETDSTTFHNTPVYGFRYLYS